MNDIEVAYCNAGNCPLDNSIKLLEPRFSLVIRGLDEQITEPFTQKWDVWIKVRMNKDRIGEVNHKVDVIVDNEELETF